MVIFLFPQESSAQFEHSDKEEFFYGEHSYVLQGNFKGDSYSKHAAGRVTFTHVPSDYDEFEAIYQVLGKTPHGTAALMPMAMEMYGRNR